MKNFFKDYLTALQDRKRPLILVGRGIRASGSVELFKEFINKMQIPVVMSLLGLDVLPYNHHLRVGFIGIYGNRWANYALGNCDLILVLGSRLDSRQTGDRKSFQENKVIYHVDIDNAELNNNISSCIILKSHLFDFLSDVNKLNCSYEYPEGWMDEIQKRRRELPDTYELKDCVGINPNVFIHNLSRTSHIAKVFTADVGSNQMWTAQSLELTDDQLFLTSGGMGAMGYSLPAAIGASITLGNAPVVSISGDGGFQVNIQELQTIVRNKLPIKMVVLNNHSLGMIRQFQDAYFGGRYQSTVFDYSTPDFVKVASAYGIDSFAVNSFFDIVEGLRRLWEYPDKPFLLEVLIDTRTNISPKVMWGKPITEMT